MKEWTEQEEQEIIERAKSGDPEANYELSLWALQRSEEEPDEPRWNRLAAKCLVKSAQAGYGPAKEKMDALLHPEDPKPAQRAPAPRDAAPAEPVSLSDVREAAARRAPAHQTTARHVAPQHAEPEEEDDGPDEDQDDIWGDEEDDEPPAPRASRRRARKEPASDESRDRSGARRESAGPKWGDAQWRKMEIICVAVCTVLLVVIAVMLFTNRRGSSSTDVNSAIPPAGEVAPAANSVAPADSNVGNYPDEATKNAIMTADLSIQPAEEDYVTGPTSGTVSVSSVGLRLRKGPNTSYDLVTEMPNGATVSVLAKKNDWFLVQYDGDEGTVYGWCSSEYIILSAGTAPTNTPGDSVG